MRRASSSRAPPRNGTATRGTSFVTSSSTASRWLAWWEPWCSCRPTSFHSPNWSHTENSGQLNLRPSGLSCLVPRREGVNGEESSFFPRKSRTILHLDTKMGFDILDELRTAVGQHGFISSPEELHTYECDGLTNFRVMPRAVLLPNSTEQVQAIVRICHRERIPFVARGSGTGLSGGALPVENGIVISLARMNRILEVDFPNARVVV